MDAPALPFQPFEPSSAVVNPRAPEQAIAHRGEALEDLVRGAGLRTTRSCAETGIPQPRTTAGRTSGSP